MSTRRSQRLNQSAGGNLSRAPSRSTERDPGGPVLKGTTISFTAAGTISDSGNGLAIFPVGMDIEVRGSASNNRRFVVQTSAAGALTVLPGVVVTEAAGAGVTIVSVD